MSEEQEPEVKQEPEPVAFSEFLESTPPSSITNVHSLARVVGHISQLPHVHKLLTPDIQLHCPNDACNGTRFFRYTVCLAAHERVGCN